MGTTCNNHDSFFQKINNLDLRQILQPSRRLQPQLPNQQKLNLQRHTQLLKKISMQVNKCFRRDILIEERSEDSQFLARYDKDKYYLFGYINTDGDGEAIVVFNNFNVYRGQLRKFKAHGKGTLYNNTNAQIQVGEWEESKFIKGSIKMHQLDSEIKTIEKKSKRQYKICFKDNAQYEGEGYVQNGSFIKHGKGKFKINNYEYNGYWKENKRQGKATVKGLGQGCIFQGFYKEDLLQKGTIKKNGNQKYELRRVNGQLIIDVHGIDQNQQNVENNMV